MRTTTIPSTSYVVFIPLQQEECIRSTKYTSNRLPKVKLLIVPLVVFTASITNPRMMPSSLVVNTLRNERSIDKGTVIFTTLTQSQEIVVDIRSSNYKSIITLNNFIECRSGKYKVVLCIRSLSDHQHHYTYFLVKFYFYQRTQNTASLIEYLQNDRVRATGSIDRLFQRSHASLGCYPSSLPSEYARIY